jgi:hypothetical protein
MLYVTFPEESDYFKQKKQRKEEENCSPKKSPEAKYLNNEVSPKKMNNIRNNENTSPLLSISSSLSYSSEIETCFGDFTDKDEVLDVDAYRIPTNYGIPINDFSKDRGFTSLFPSFSQNANQQLPIISTDLVTNSVKSVERCGIYLRYDLILKFVV